MNRNPQDIFRLLKVMAINLDTDRQVSRAEYLSYVADVVHEMQTTLRALEWQGCENGNRCPYCGNNNYPTPPKHKQHCKLGNLLSSEDWNE